MILPVSAQQAAKYFPSGLNLTALTSCLNLYLCITEQVTRLIICASPSEKQE